MTGFSLRPAAVGRLPLGRLALTLWLVVLTVVCVRVWHRPQSHNVYPIFATAARNWVAAADLYGPVRPDIDLYRYSPLVAALYVPFAVLPDSLGDALWRALGVAVLLGALRWWAARALPLRADGRAYGVLLLLTLPLAASSVNNGQSNPLLIGLVLAAVAGAADRRWNLASACLALACMLKVYPVAVGLLLAAVYPRQLAGRLALALLAAALLPFALQDPAYVAGQYQSWLGHLLSDQRVVTAENYWLRDVRLLFQAWLGPLPAGSYPAVQALAGLAMALVCVAARRLGMEERPLLTLLTGLGCCWMTAFGPMTESCTYILLGPSLAAALLLGWRERGAPWLRAALAGSLGLFLAAGVALWFPFGKDVGRLGPQPLGALLLLAGLLGLAARAWPRRQPAAVPAGVLPHAA